MNNSCIACEGTGKAGQGKCPECDGLERIRTMNEPVQLVTTKPDIELAEELKQEILENLKPVLASATKALKLGFHVQLNMSPNSFREVVVQQLQLIKTF